MKKRAPLFLAGAIVPALVLLPACGGGGGSRSGGSRSGGAPAAATPAPTAAPGALVTVTVDPILAQGAGGNDVIALQALLNGWRMRGGVPAIAQDGDFGPATLAALERFQADAAMPVTGIAWQQTWDALRRPFTTDALGTIDPIGTPVTPDAYIGPTTAADVRIHVLPPIEVRPGAFESPLVFQSQMTIDADGAGPAWRSDPNGQSGTSLAWPNGDALDPLVIPYFVLPIGFETEHPEVRIGDLAAVVWRGRVTFAIYGDRGPRGKIGEASILTAGRLGIPANPSRGGAANGVTYVVFPGSGTRAAMPPAEIDRLGRELFAKAGGRP